jgi:hypothetical protein
MRTQYSTSGGGIRLTRRQAYSMGLQQLIESTKEQL